MTDMDKTPRHCRAEDLHAYVDDAMPAANRRRFEALLAADPALAQQAALLRLQKDMLHQTHAAVLEEEIPQRLLDAVYGRPREAAPPFGQRAWERLFARPALGFVTVALLCLLSGYIGWTAQGYGLRQAHEKAVQTAMAPRPAASTAAPATAAADTAPAPPLTEPEDKTEIRKETDAPPALAEAQNITPVIEPAVVTMDSPAPGAILGPEMAPTLDSQPVNF